MPCYLCDFGQSHKTINKCIYLLIFFNEIKNWIYWRFSSSHYGMLSGNSRVTKTLSFHVTLSFSSVTFGFTQRTTEECLSINRVDEGFLPFLSWLSSIRMIPSSQSHQQASFHLSMRQTIMSKAETHIPPSLPPTVLYIPAGFFFQCTLHFPH